MQGERGGGERDKQTERQTQRPLVSLLIKTLILSNWAPRMTSFNINYFLRGPITENSHIGGKDFILQILKGHTPSVHAMWKLQLVSGFICRVCESLVKPHVWNHFDVCIPNGSTHVQIRVLNCFSWLPPPSSFSRIGPPSVATLPVVCISLRKE